MFYKHTQTGYLILCVLVAVVLIFGIVLEETGSDYRILSMMFFISVLLLSFTFLEVMIDGSYLRIKFGYGIFKKSFMLKEIISVRTVKNHWYYGWGIRLWLWPRMWVYNVSGLDAVEIKMKDGKIYRIGTDEPRKLEYAIMQSLR